MVLAGAVPTVALCVVAYLLAYLLAGLLVNPERKPPPIIWFCVRLIQSQKKTNIPIEAIISPTTIGRVGSMGRTFE